MDCLFCKIINGEIPSEKVYEDEYVYAFKDISPIAPVHVLIVPKKHIASVNEITADDEKIVCRIMMAAAKIAKELKVAENGYRVVTNCGADAGQTVFHLHYHLLAGKKLSWEA